MPIRARLKSVAWNVVAWNAVAEPFALTTLAYARFLEHTCDVADENAPPRSDKGRIFVNWHRDLPWLLAHHGFHQRWLLQSQAPYMAPIRRWCQRLGMRIIPGASGEGLSGAVERMAAKIVDGEDVVIAVDGPAGPVFESKRGPARLSRLTGADIIPVSYRTSRDLTVPFRWDHMRLHLPGEVVRFVYGPAVVLPDDESDDVKAIADALNALPTRL